MATYLQGVKHLAEGEAKRYAWFCGPERRLVEELVALYRRNVGSPARRIDVEEEPESAVWSAMSVHAAEPQLVVVRSAERIRDWDRFLDIDFAPVPRLHVCFISNEENTDTKPEHMRVILRRGRFVRCGPFTRYDDAVRVLQLHRAIEPGAADLLLQRAGSVSRAVDVLAMCSYFSPDEAVPYAVVERLVSPSPNDDYVGALTALRVREATEAVASVAPSDYPMVIGRLDFRLTALARLNAAMRRSTVVADLVRLTKLDHFVVRDLYGLARLYDRRRVQVASEALAMVDARVGEGETDLVLETLAMLWAA